MEEKIAEKNHRTSNRRGDIDIDGDEITIKSKKAMSPLVPRCLILNCPLRSEFKKGNIVSVMNSEAYMLVIIEDVEADDFMDYYNKLKGEFDKESYEAKSADTIAYTGKNEEGIGIMASYTVSDKTASISASTGE